MTARFVALRDDDVAAGGNLPLCISGRAYQPDNSHAFHVLAARSSLIAKAGGEDLHIFLENDIDLSAGLVDEAVSLSTRTSSTPCFAS